MFSKKKSMPSQIILVCSLGALLAAGCGVFNYIHHENTRDNDYSQGWDISGATQALKSSPNEPTAHIAMVEAWMKNKQFANAVKEYQRAIKLEPTNAYTYLDLGNALASSGQLSQARTQWQTAVRIDVAGGDAAKEASEKLSGPTPTQ